MPGSEHERAAAQYGGDVRAGDTHRRLRVSGDLGRRPDDTSDAASATAVSARARPPVARTWLREPHPMTAFPI